MGGMGSHGRGVGGGAAGLAEAGYGQGHAAPGAHGNQRGVVDPAAGTGVGHHGTAGVGQNGAPGIGYDGAPGVGHNGAATGGRHGML